MRLTAHIDACADALTLNNGSGNEHLIELVRTLSPSGKIPPNLAARFDPGISPNRRL
jgi:hypothetical protein